MRKDGSRFPVLIIEAPLINAEGVQTGWMSAFLDISEQRRVEELSRASQERLQATARLATVGEMASLLSHELNQPLAAISSYATGSHEPAEVDGRAGRAAPTSSVAMRRIAEQAERAGKVIKSVHDFVRRRDKAREAGRRRKPCWTPSCRWSACRRASSGVRVDTRVADRPAARAVRPHHGRTGAAQSRAQCACRPWTRPAWPSPSLVIAGAPRRRHERGQRQGWLEFSVADLGPGIADEVKAAAVHALLHHQGRRHGPGPVACAARWWSSMGIPRVRAQPAARYDFPVHPAGATPRRPDEHAA